jgi:hypothetical protein
MKEVGAKWLLSAFGFSVFGACASTPPPRAEHPLALRAPFDLDCPKKKIRYRALGPDTIGATGCGQRVTYVRVCRDAVDNGASFMLGTTITETKCQWIMNTARK